MKSSWKSFENQSFLLPNAGPFYFHGGETGCILIHGFSCTPEEMLPLGKALHQQGYTVYGVRLSGHGTHPKDLKRVHWQDWITDLEEGMSLLKGHCSKIVLIGQSLGGMLSLTAAAAFHPQAVISLSTPYQDFAQSELWSNLFLSWLRPMIDKNTKRDPQFGIRKEAAYPAYAAFPSKIFQQVYALNKALNIALPHLDMPVLLIQSRADHAIPPKSLDFLSGKIKSPHKQTLWLENIGHGMTMDPERELVFTQLFEFLNQI